MSPGPGYLLSPWSAGPYSAQEAMTPGGSMILKSVVTRTMTFARPPAPLMEPVPASKKRRIEGPIVEESSEAIGEPPAKRVVEGVES
jgi:hypothetical protein